MDLDSRSLVRKSLGNYEYVLMKNSRTDETRNWVFSEHREYRNCDSFLILASVLGT